MPGSKQAIYEILALFQGPVILPQPSWVGYLPIAQLLNKEIVRLPTPADHGYRITADRSEAAWLRHFATSSAAARIPCLFQ